MTGGSGWRLAAGNADPATWHLSRAYSMQSSIQPSTQSSIQPSRFASLANRPTDQPIN